MLKPATTGAIGVAILLTGCASAGDGVPAPAGATPTSIALDSLNVGDCLSSLLLKDGRVSVLPCDDSGIEVIAFTSLTPMAFPGENAASGYLQDACEAAFTEYQTSNGVAESSFIRSTFGPTGENWPALQQRNPCAIGKGT